MRGLGLAVALACGCAHASTLAADGGQAPPRGEGLHGAIAVGAGVATVDRVEVVQAVVRLGAAYTGWYHAGDRGAGVSLDASFDPGARGDDRALVTALGAGAFAVAGRLRGGAALDVGAAAVDSPGRDERTTRLVLAPRVYASWDVGSAGRTTFHVGIQARAGAPYLAQVAATLGVRIR